MNNLAHTLYALGRYTEALPLHERALTIAEVALDPDHPDIGRRLHNLATTLAGLGRHTDALPLQQRAMTIAQATLGPDHPTTHVIC